MTECVFQETRGAAQANLHTHTLENDNVFIFVNSQLARGGCFPPLHLAVFLVSLHGGGAAAATGKSSGKLLMDKNAAAPQTLASGPSLIFITEE